MRQAAQDMSSARDVLVQESNTLRSECTAIQPAWKGSAGTAFQHLMTRYDDGFKKLMQSLQGIEEQLLGAARDVDAQQEADNQSLSQITNALGG
jgi:WXG100 family type VII secretion target